jgi:hypothetical protein
MRGWTVRVLIVLGVLVGLWHLRLALEAIFVFRNDEPIASWLAVVLGPGLTLLGVLLAVPKPKLGGAMLIVAGTLAFAIFFEAAGAPDAVAGFFQMFTLPSILLGTVFLVLG